MSTSTNICTFNNRVALVTGAAGNIGFAVCRRLTAHGFLAADESGFITGVDIPVEGGRILGPHNCDM